MTTITTTSRLIALALATATFTTALAAGASAGQAFRVAPVSVHNAAGIEKNAAFARAAAPVASFRVAKLPPRGTTPVSRVRPADDSDCLEAGGEKVLCTHSVSEHLEVITTLATILSLF